MKRSNFPLASWMILLFAAVFSLTACSPDVEIPTASDDAEGVLSKKGNQKGGDLQKGECSGRTELLDSRAILNFANSFEDEEGVSVTAAVVSDDGPYTGGADGVHAKIFYHDGSCSRSGDAIFSPDWDAKGNGNNARKLVFHFPENSIGLTTGGAPSGVFLNFRAIMQLGSDVNGDGEVNGRDAKIEEKAPGHDVALEYPDPFYTKPTYPTWGIEGRRFRINVEFKGCEHLEYDKMKVTRTSNTDAFQPIADDLGVWSHEADDLGNWIAESIPTTRDVDGTPTTGHWARCLVRTGGSDVEPNGAWMDMPFKVEVTEDRP